MTTADKATLLRRLHADPALLVLVNVWDVASARVVAALPGCAALATASQPGRAATTAAVDLPVTADLEAGYGDPGDTVRRAIALGVVGANLEDQMRPMPEAVAAVAAAVAAGAAEGVDFVLNARTDAFLRTGQRPAADILADAVARGRAYVDAGALVVFVPGRQTAEEVAALVDGIGPVSLIALPGSIPLRQMHELGVQRVSVGPWSQRIALTALADAGTAILAGGGIPEGTRALN